MDQKPFRTLILWVIWATAALVIYLSLYSDTEIWSFLEHDPSKITWLILVLFAMGLLGSFVLTIMVTKESLRAAEFNKAAQQGGLNAVTAKSNLSAADRFFHGLKSTIDSKGKPEVETLLNVELAVYERIGHMVELVGNLLITLGLIGTVMGLTLTLTGLTGSLDALGHDQEMLLLGLRTAMSGMGTAFYTTLLGAVLGGVLLRMFAQISLHGVESLHDSLLRICMVYCSADYAQTMERDVRHLNVELTSMEKNVRHLQQALADSHAVMNEFRAEIKRLNEDQPNDQDKPLHDLIAQHRAYCDSLRGEMRMLASMNKPFLIRLRDLFRPGK